LGDIQSLEDALAVHPSCQRIQGVLFSQIRHAGGTVQVGFRCFDCDADRLLVLFAQRDFEEITRLPFATDAAGEPGTSLVRLDIAHVPGSDLVGAQPVLYSDYVPSPAAPALILEGEEARGWLETFRGLDQTAGS